MSDAMSSMLKPTFWETFFKNFNERIKNNKKLVSLIEDYEIIYSLDDADEDRDLKPMKKEIMNGFLSLYGEKEYSKFMFLEEGRFPDGYEIIKSLETP